MCHYAFYIWNKCKYIEFSERETTRRWFVTWYSRIAQENNSVAIVRSIWYTGQAIGIYLEIQWSLKQNHVFFFSFLATFCIRYWWNWIGKTDAAIGGGKPRDQRRWKFWRRRKWYRWRSRKNWIKCSLIKNRIFENCILLSKLLCLTKETLMLC